MANDKTIANHLIKAEQDAIAKNPVVTADVDKAVRASQDEREQRFAEGVVPAHAEALDKSKGTELSRYEAMCRAEFDIKNSGGKASYSELYSSQDFPPNLTPAQEEKAAKEKFEAEKTAMYKQLTPADKHTADTTFDKVGAIDRLPTEKARNEAGVSLLNDELRGMSKPPVAPGLGHL